MKFKNITTKRILSALMAITFVGTIATSAMAANPQFNSLQGDLELIAGRNISKGQIAPSDPVIADPTDTVEAIIYYHNNVADSTANNVRIAATLPQNSVVAASHMITASIKSDNTASVTDTVVNGVVVGKSNFTINLSAVASIEAIPGSVRWFPDGSQTAHALPNGQTGDEIFSANGVNIGSVLGCWAHSGFVMVRVRFKTPVVGSPVIVKSKSAYNDTQKIDATKVVANAGDQITYTLTTKNTGTADQANFVISDGIRDILDYADVIAISDNGQKIDMPNDSVRDNQALISYPAVTIKMGESVVRTFVIKVKNPIPTNPQNGNAFDHVMFNLYGNSVVIVVAQPVVVLTPFVTIQKDVRNVTKNETAFIDSNTASRSDTLEYQIKVKNSGTKTIDARLTDILPNGVSMIDGSVVVKRGADVVTPVTGNIVTDGVLLQNLSQNTEFTVYFRVSVANNLADSTNLVNKAIVTFENTSKEDIASTLVLVPAQPAPVTNPTAPTVTPNPVQSSLPSTGANPFAIMFLMVSLAYTWISRASVKKEFKHLSAYVNIV